MTQVTLQVLQRVGKGTAEKVSLWTIAKIAGTVHTHSIQTISNK